VLDDIQPRWATQEHLAALRALRDAEGWRTASWTLRALIELPDAGVLLVGPDHAPAGVVAFTRFERLGHVSSVIVAPAYRRQGLGRHLMTSVLAHLAVAGATQVELDATRSGLPLYESLGFVPRGRTRTLLLPCAAPSVSWPDIAVADMAGADLPSLIAFDQAVIGASRATLLTYLFALPGWRWLCAIDAHGVIAGYLAAWPGGLGPWLARDRRVAEALLSALGERTRRYLAFPEMNTGAAALFDAMGATQIDSDTHMVRGDGVRTAWECVYALAHPTIG